MEFVRLLSNKQIRTFRFLSYIFGLRKKHKENSIRILYLLLFARFVYFHLIFTFPQELHCCSPSWSLIKRAKTCSMIPEETIRHSSSRKNAPGKNASWKNVPLKMSPWKTGPGKIVSQENWPPANCTLENFPRKIAPFSPWKFFWISYFYGNFRLSKIYQFLFLMINNNFFILDFSIIFFRVRIFLIFSYNISANVYHT